MYSELWYVPGEAVTQTYTSKKEIAKLTSGVKCTDLCTKARGDTRILMYRLTIAVQVAHAFPSLLLLRCYCPHALFRYTETYQTVNIRYQIVERIR